MSITLWLFLLPFCLLNLSTSIILVTSYCFGHQQSLLLQLRNNLVFDHTMAKKLIHWNQSDDCCEWNGVECNKGLVIALDISQESISGGIEIFGGLLTLQYLQSLNLADNAFHSEIPPEIPKAKEFEAFEFLETLDLSSIVTSEHALKLEMPNIAMLVHNLTKIKELHLDGIAISAKEKEWSHVTNLEVLSMSSCNLSGPFDSSLAKLQYLSILQLDQNSLASPVPESFGNLSNLTNLQLSGYESHSTACS
ncbi:hypothetical protein VNO78_25357 [Psophocarpus tetragonolobus]|uniref:Leucine-rich repeat-containing N-terminal plant-type domain-containing protein n=1 Tax=Psophocarpus tetragonolobus TaxID=3891 RepID=A0AAN9XFR2_PSOTE